MPPVAIAAQSGATRWAALAEQAADVNGLGVHGDLHVMQGRAAEAGDHARVPDPRGREVRRKHSALPQPFWQSTSARARRSPAAPRRARAPRRSVEGLGGDEHEVGARRRSSAARSATAKRAGAAAGVAEDARAQQAVRRGAPPRSRAAPRSARGCCASRAARSRGRAPRRRRRTRSRPRSLPLTARHCRVGPSSEVSMSLNLGSILMASAPRSARARGDPPEPARAHATPSSTAPRAAWRRASTRAACARARQVAVMVPNVPEFTIAYFGILYAGCTRGAAQRAALGARGHLPHPGLGGGAADRASAVPRAREQGRAGRGRAGRLVGRRRPRRPAGHGGGGAARARCIRPRPTTPP